MGNLTAKITVKFQINGIDAVRPRKEVSQHFEIYTIHTQAIDDYDMLIRKIIACMILKYGTDVDDWGEFP